MNGYEIFNRVLSRLGYNNTPDKNTENVLLLRVKEFINQILLDLNMQIVNNLTQPINCSAAEEDALLCGVCMLFALSEGDTGKNSIYSHLYSSKRSSLLSKAGKVEDVLPTSIDGGS